MIRLKESLLFLLMLLAFPACDDDESRFPDYDVYVKTTYSEYQTLMVANRCVCYAYDDVYTTNERIGLGGICILRDIEKNLHAFDLACPFECLREATLTVEMPYATCSQCGSVFDLTYGLGNPISGPAEQRMKEYTKVIDRYDYIVVTN